MSLRNCFLNRSLRKASGDVAKTGKLGELLAKRYLSREKGHRILLKNWRSGRDELDLICMDGTVLVFVEVRTRKSGSLVSGYRSIGSGKKKALLRACKQYLWSLRSRPRTFRFDVVDIAVSQEGSPLVHHYENVSLFPKNFRP